MVLRRNFGLGTVTHGNKKHQKAPKKLKKCQQVFFFFNFRTMSYGPKIKCCVTRTMHQKFGIFDQTMLNISKSMVKKVNLEINLVYCDIERGL